MISTAMEKALFDQLNHEFSSAYLYLAMSAYCSHLEFNGAATWLKLQYEEEHMHATNSLTGNWKPDWVKIDSTRAQLMSVRDLGINSRFN